MVLGFSTPVSPFRIVTLTYNCHFQHPDYFWPGNCLECMMYFLEIFIGEKPNFSMWYEVYRQVWSTKKQIGAQNLTSALWIFPLSVNFPFLYSSVGLGMPTFLFDFIINYPCFSMSIKYMYPPTINGRLLFHCVCFHQALTDGHLFIYINLYIYMFILPVFCSSLQCFLRTFTYITVYLYQIS